MDSYKSRWCKCHRCPQGQPPCIGADCLWFGDNLVKSIVAAEDADRGERERVNRGGANTSVRQANEARRASALARARTQAEDSGFQVERGRDGEYIVTEKDGSKRVVKM